MKTSNCAAILTCFLLASCISAEHEHGTHSLSTPAGNVQGCESAEAAPQAAEHVHSFVPEHYPEPFGADLMQSWFEPWTHTHFSRRGTPFVHLFGLEPAFMDRDLFMDYRSVKGPGGDAAEFEVELEWTLTRRFGVAFEAPYARLDPDDANSVSGLGDFAIAPRALLVDSEIFLLSANFEIAVPSGDEDKGLGAGEVSLAPSLSAWLDLGHWLQASLQIGSEHGLESGNAQLFYNGALAYSFLTPELLGTAWHDHDHPGGHFPSGLMTVILELTGRTVLEGQAIGRDSAELLFGLSYNLTGDWELRSGYQVPVGAAEDIDRAFVLSLIRHF